MKMKSLALTALLVSPAVVAEEKATPAIDIEKEINKTVLIVNGDKMTLGHLFAYRDTRQGLPLPEDVMQAQDILIDELLTSMLLSQEAVKMGLDKNSLVIAAVEVARQQALRQAALNALLAREQVSDEAVKAAYDAQYAQSESNEYKARHILVEDEASAKEIINALDDGADFAELAKEKSTGPSGPQGGDLGWFSLDRMVKPFSDAVALMKKGSYSKTPVKTDFGWHVIKLEDQRENKTAPPALETIKPQLVQQLKIEAARKYLEQLHSKADIVIPDESVLEAIEK